MKKNKNLRIVNCDIANYTKIERYFKNVNFVFHMAGLADIVPSIENPEKYFKSNVVGTFNVLQASKKFRIKNLYMLLQRVVMDFQKNFQQMKVIKFNQCIHML